MSEFDTFRDAISTVDTEGKRAWVFPKKPVGKFTDYRKRVGYTLFIFLVVAPFIKINGNQFILIHILQRKFHLFGFVFWPQDFHLLVIAMIIGVVFVALFTVVFGRLFCGWVCPQTIFMELIFRPIEYWIEGNRNAQIKLDRAPWTFQKILKRTLKWLLFFLVSFFISNVFLAYLISSDRLLKYITEGPFLHLDVVVPLLLFTGVFYFIYAWFREQVCVIACPYGRLQGVLLDNKSIVVAYDYKRGEGQKGRKKWSNKEDRSALGHGDCIDCKQCVHVCPTGIDIRNGTQMECINCTACMDECATIMDKVGLPKGLIRYASEEEIQTRAPFRFSLRMKGYAGVLTLLLGVLSVMLFLRNDIEANLYRIPGQLYQRIDADTISNVFTYKLVNKTPRALDSIHFVALSHNASIRPVGSIYLSIAPNALGEGSLFITMNQQHIKASKIKLKIGVYNGHELLETIQGQFLAPKKFY